MKTALTLHRKASRRAFSLAELLITISVVGILAAISVTVFSNTNGAAKDAKSKRNAQMIVSLHTNAQSVGADFSSDHKEGIVDELIDGVQGVDIGGVDFRLSPLSESEIEAALAYVSFDRSAELMEYHADGAPTDPDGPEPELEIEDPLDWSDFPPPVGYWQPIASFPTAQDASNHINFLLSSNSGGIYNINYAGGTFGPQFIVEKWVEEDLMVR